MTCWCPYKAKGFSKDHRWHCDHPYNDWIMAGRPGKYLSWWKRHYKVKVRKT